MSNDVGRSGGLLNGGALPSLDDRPQRAAGLLNSSPTIELRRLAREACDAALELECARIRRSLAHIGKRKVSDAKVASVLRVNVRQYIHSFVAALLEIQREARDECRLDPTAERILVYRRAAQRWRDLARIVDRPRGRPKTNSRIPQSLLNSASVRTTAVRKGDRALARQMIEWVAAAKIRKFIEADGLPHATPEEALSHIYREQAVDDVLRVQANAQLVRQFIRVHGADPTLQKSFEVALSRRLRSFVVGKIAKR